MRLALLLTLILTLFIAAQTYAQPGKLIDAGSPQPASIEGYHRGHCVTLPNRIRICKLLSDNADVFLVEKEGKTIGIWPSTAYLGTTDDFEVLRGDLDGDRQPEIIVANRDSTSNGLGVSVYTITIFPNTDFRTFQSPLTFSVQEYGSFGTFVHSAGHVNILTTYWVSGDDPKRGGGLYLVGQWWRYKSGELVPLLNRNAIARRYLFSFERERWDTLTSDRIPYRWLANHNATTVTTEFITGASTRSKGGVIQSLSTAEKSYRAVKIAFQPDGEQAATLLYPSDEDEGETRSLYIGDATSGRVYPNRYLPLDPEKWFSGKRATLRTYNENRIEVLWLEPQKSTKATK